MTTGEQLKKGLGLPPVSQLCIVVKDVEKACQHFESTLGVGPFHIYEFSPDKSWYREKLTPVKLRIAKAQWNNLELEVTTLLEGKCPYLEFTKRCGEGIQHFGFDVPDYDQAYKKFAEAGFKPIWRVESYYPAYKGQLKACCFDTDKVGGIVFEILWRSWKR